MMDRQCSFCPSYGPTLFGHPGCKALICSECVTEFAASPALAGNASFRERLTVELVRANPGKSGAWVRDAVAAILGPKPAGRPRKGA